MNHVQSPRRWSPLHTGVVGTFALLASTLTGCALDAPSDVEPDDLGAMSAELAGPVPAGPVTISRLTYNGTGCPLGTLEAHVSEDKQALVVTQTEFVAEAGPGIPLSAGRRNCVLNLTLAVPAGWQYTLGAAYLRAFVDLDRSVRASFSTSAFFQGAGVTGVFSVTKNGPLSQELVVNDPTALTGVGWSPCNATRALALNTSVRLARTDPNVPSARGLFTNDAVDGEVTEVLGLAWRRCP